MVRSRTSHIPNSAQWCSWPKRASATAQEPSADVLRAVEGLGGVCAPSPHGALLLLSQSTLRRPLAPLPVTLPARAACELSAWPLCERLDALRERARCTKGVLYERADSAIRPTSSSSTHL